MSDYALSATLKARSSSKYDAPWVVVYANDPGELKQRIEGVVAQGVLDALVGADNQLKVLSDSDFQPAQQGQPQQPQAAWGTATDQGFQPGQHHPQNQPQQGGGWQGGQQQAPQVRMHPEGKTCGCGATLQYKEVNRKSDGKVFKFWACPNQKSRDDGHASEFAN